MLTDKYSPICADWYIDAIQNSPEYKALQKYKPTRFSQIRTQFGNFIVEVDLREIDRLKIVGGLQFFTHYPDFYSFVQGKRNLTPSTILIDMSEVKFAEPIED